MKNTITLKLNENHKTLHNDYRLNYLGKEIVLTKREKESFDVLFGETIIRFVKKVVKLIVDFKSVIFREENIMKNVRKVDSNSQECHQSCLLFCCKTPTDYWNNALDMRNGR